MGLSYRAAPAFANTGSTGVTSTSVTKQAGTASGDWILVYIFGGTTSMACSGFTAKPDPNGFGGLLYRLADGTEGSSFSVTGLAGNRVSTMIVTVAGASSTLDPATVATPTSGGAATSIPVAGITLANANDWVLWFAANQNGFSGAGMATTPPSGFTNQGTNGALGSNATVMLADIESIGSGATGTKTGTFTSASFYSGVMVGFTPGGTSVTAGLASAAASAPDPSVAVMSGVHAGLASAAASAPDPTVSIPSQANAGLASAAATAPAPAVSSNTTAQAGLASAAATAPAPAVRTSVFLGYSGGPGRPMPLPGGSQVAVAQAGTGNWSYLGSLGHVTGLRYSFVMPGGCDKMSCTLQVPAAYRTQPMNPGWQVRVYRGGHVVWRGKMDEPAPGPGGWAMTAVGDGQRAADFAAVYSGTWPSGQPDDAVNQAIARGLPWTNTGVGQPSWAWFGQAQESGAQTVKALLDLITTRGTGTWYVNSQPGGPPGSGLALFQVPTIVNRLLLCTTPVPRTLGGDVNRLFLRYQASADDPSGSGAAATYGLTSVTNTASVGQHQAAEAYLDLSNAGVMSAAGAQAVGNGIMGLYQRASFAGPFTVAPGQLMTTGGQPVDLGAEQAGTVVKLILSDFAFGGEVTPQFPVTFPVGGYEWDDEHQVATVTPFQTLDQSFSGLTSLAGTVLAPLANKPT